MKLLVQIGFVTKDDTVQILESEFISEDWKYLRLASGDYIKTRIVSRTSRIIYEEGDEEE